MTSNEYIVKNCPCLKSQISYKDKLWVNGCSELGEVGSRMCCQDITDCLIKQVVDMCRDEMRFDRKSELALATDINSFFDIEEINK